MGDLEFRQPTPDEIGEFLRLSIQSYGSDGSDEEVAHEVLSNEIERSYGALDGDSWVAGSGAFSLEMTMPGGAQVPAAGVTMIGVSPTHRRRGILTRMLRWLHADARRRGEPIALLTATETSIYRRFGYGMASDVTHLEIPAAAVRFDPPLEDAGTFSPIDPHAGTAEMSGILERVRHSRVGWLSLSQGMWQQIRLDPASGRPGRTPLRAVLHRDASGTPDGYGTWRIERHTGSDRIAANTLHIEQLVGTDPDVEAALWTFVASVDLVTSVAWECGPVEPAIRWRLVEPRQLRALARADMVWARLLDVAGALSSRTYGASGTLTLEVTDRFDPDSGGRFRLECAGRGETGRCERVDDAEHAADLTLDTADLASVTVGAVSPSVLADARRLQGPASAIDLADAMFDTSQVPWWPIEF